MSKVYTDPTNYSNIADAIREKLGGETTYKPAQMPAAIRAIETAPEIEPLTITENGTYTAPSGTDGYSPITVEVAGGGLAIGDYAVTTESPGIAVEQNLSNWSWYAGVSFPNAYANGVNTITGYSGGSGYERLKKTVSGLSQFTWYLFSFKFYSPSGFVDGQYGDPFACAVNSTSSSYPSGTGALSSAYSYINGMTKRLNHTARSTPEEYQILFNTKNQTAAYLSFEFGSITDGVPIDMVFSDLKFEKVLSIRKITAEPTYEPITITENGTYTPEYPILGYAPVTVNVEADPEISPLVVTENGTYTAPSGTDGYSPVTVNVPATEPDLTDVTITQNGTYTHTGHDGYDEVVVNVQGGHAAYSYYRLYITKFTRNGTQQSYASIAEFSLYDANQVKVSSRTGCTYTANNYYSADETPDKAFDGNSSTLWHSDWESGQSLVNWLMVHLPEPCVVTQFGIVPRSDSYVDRPVDFQLQASNDGASWNIIFSATDLSSGWSVNTERKFPTYMVPAISALTVTENGTYTAPAGTDGYSPVTVNVPAVEPDLVDATITQNGTYTHTGHDGYDTVVVNVSGGGLPQTSPDLTHLSYKNFGALKVKEFVTGTFTGSSVYLQPYLNNAAADFDWSQPFEIGVVVRHKGTINNVQAVFGCCTSGQYYKAPGIDIESGGCLFSGFSSNGTSWTNYAWYGSGSILPDTWYSITCKWDGTNFETSVTRDYVTYNTQSVPISTAHYHSSSYPFAFGGIAQSSAHNGSKLEINLLGTYVKINGTLMWGCDFLQTNSLFEYRGTTGALLEEKAVTLTENGTTVVEPGTNRALSKVTVTANVPSAEPDLTDVTITQNGTYTHTGHDGYDKVVVDVSGGAPATRLPSEYQEVEYLLSTGTQYIDTGIAASSDISVRIEFALTSALSTDTKIFGIFDNVGPTDLLGTNASRFRILPYGDSWSQTSIPTDSNWHTVIFRDSYGRYLFDGVLVKTRSNTWSSSLTYLLFSSKGDSLPTSMKLKSFQMKRLSTGEVLRNFVPCYRKEDQVPGLYDLVSGTLFTNIGTGAFSVGLNVYYTLDEITATANGTYEPPTGTLGFSKVTVDVQAEPEITSLVVTENGIYTPPSGIDGYSPVTVNVSGSGNAVIHWYAPRVCLGDRLLKIHSDCELKVPFSTEPFSLSANIASIARVDSLNIQATLDTANLAEGENVTFSGSIAGYQYANGTATALSIPIERLLITDLYEPISPPAYGGRNVLCRMTAVRNNVQLDSGADAVTFTRSFKGIGITAGFFSTLYANGDSYITVGSVSIYVNQRDSSSYYVWKEEGTYGDGTLYFMKIRWKGSSAYNGAIDQEWEMIFLSNGDIILRLIRIGGSSGSFSFLGSNYPYAANTTTCFYRKDYYGVFWDIRNEVYSMEHHYADSELLYKTNTFSTVKNQMTTDITCINNVGYDDDAYTFNLDSTFTWHGATYLSVSGNSFIGVGSGAENVKMHRRDSKMWYLYACYWILSDLNNLKALQVSWKGASVWNGAIDRIWSLWLFENGDAMIYISSIGNTGTCDFFGQSYTGTANSYTSFYYDATAGNYQIIAEAYNPEHHIDTE